MKKTLIAVTAAASVFAATQAQAYFFVMPLIAAGIGGNEIGKSIAEAQAERKETLAKAAQQYRIDRHLMAETEALAKSCLVNRTAPTCREFIESYHAGTETGPYATAVVQEVFGNMCERSSKEVFPDIDKPLCAQIGYPNENMRIIVQMEEHSESWEH